MNLFVFLLVLLLMLILKICSIFTIQKETALSRMKERLMEAESALELVVEQHSSDLDAWKQKVRF